MRTSFSSVDLYHFARELNDFSIKIDQIYIYDKKHIVFRLYMRNEGKRYLRIELPGLAYISEQYPPAPQRASSQTMYFRKHLTGAFVDKVSSVERTLVLDVSKGGSKSQLIIEFFDKGNILLVKDGIIKGVLERQAWAHRLSQTGEAYTFVQKDVSVLTHSFDDILPTLDVTQPLSKVLAMQIGLGGEFAKEACIKTTIDGQRTASELSAAEWSLLYQTIKSFYDIGQSCIYVKNQDEQSYTIDNKQVVSVCPIHLEQYKEICLPTKNFNQALDRVYGAVKISASDALQTAPQKKQLSKTERILLQLDQQEKQLIESAQEYGVIGEYLYTHFQEVEQLLEDVKALEKTDSSLIKEKYPKVSYDGAGRRISFRTD